MAAGFSQFYKNIPKPFHVHVHVHSSCTFLRYHGTYKCPFGSTAVRTAPLVKKDELSLPGPAHYQRRPDSEGGGAKEKGGVAKPQQLSYTFASTTNRLYSPPSIVTVSREGGRGGGREGGRVGGKKEGRDGQKKVRGCACTERESWGEGR